MKNKGIAVISVGNLVMGGAGKTPHTIAIAKEYMRRDKKVAIISLGYKGRLGYNINVISDGKEFFHKPPIASDEPFMIGVNCPGAVVITGKRREESIALARDKFGCHIAILDDGFQYKKAERDANILLLDHQNPISTGFPFPFGYLREFPSAATRADIVIFTRAVNNNIPQKAQKYIIDIPVFFSSMITDTIIFEGKEYSSDYLRGRKVAAFSGVASNLSFKNSLLSLALNVVYFKGFQDHSLPNGDCLEKIIANGNANGAEFFVTTEKDFVKLEKRYQSLFGYLKMEIDIKNSDGFFATLNNLIK